MIDTNLWSVIYGVDAALPIMRRQGPGHIVNTASISGLLPFPGQALYNTTRYAVVGMSESLRFEFAEEGIYFSVVCPCNVISRIFQKPIIGAADENRKSPADAIPADQAIRGHIDGRCEQAGDYSCARRPGREELASILREP
jgi:NAD(P)-dependent dehydrogenase (short-subunit alcohol dehydrogenase family)